MIGGVVIGIVTDNKDPDKLCRIKVKFPVDSDPAVESTWVRMITPMAGKDRGLVMIPEVGTEVVLGFAYQTLVPYVLGAVYNGGDDTPDPYANADGDDNLRVFESRSGHRVTFDDTDGSEKVEIVTYNEEVTITLDASGQTLSVQTGADTKVEATGNVTIKCVDFSIEASGGVTLEATSSFEAKANGSAKVEATGVLTLKGATTLLN